MFTIRPARQDDLNRIYEVVAAAFGPFCMAKLLEDRYGPIDGRPWQEHKGGEVVKWCRAHIDNVVVAEVDGNVAGFATFRCEGDVGHVCNNAVDPAFQGRGIGTRLIHHVLRRMLECGARRFVVTTMEHDAPARRVYEKLGFKLTETTAHLTRRAGDTVERRHVALSEVDDARAEGFELIARSVHYAMTADDFLAAERRLGLAPTE